MVGGSVFIEAVGVHGEVLGGHLAKARSTVLHDLLGAVLELLEDFRAGVAGLDRLLNHHVERAAAAEEGELVMMVFFGGHDEFVVKAVGLLGSEGRRHEDHFRAVLDGHHAKGIFDGRGGILAAEMAMHFDERSERRYRRRVGLRRTRSRAQMQAERESDRRRAERQHPNRTSEASLRTGDEHVVFS